jgi:hypothetical protein
VKRIPNFFLDVRKNRINPDCLWVATGQGTPTPFAPQLKIIRIDDNGVAWIEWDMVPDEVFHELFSSQRANPPDPQLMLPIGSTWVPSEPGYDVQGAKWRGWMKLDDAAPDWPDWLDSAGPQAEFRGYGFMYVSDSAAIAVVQPILPSLTITDKLDLSPKGIRSYLIKNNRLGIVWHHPDGRMAIVRATEFGIQGESLL